VRLVGFHHKKLSRIIAFILYLILLLLKSVLAMIAPQNCSFSGREIYKPRPLFSIHLHVQYVEAASSEC
jgi:hypothetical protein